MVLIPELKHKEHQIIDNQSLSDATPNLITHRNSFVKSFVTIFTQIQLNINHTFLCVRSTVEGRNPHKAA